jgi:hypothetical protein
LLIVSVNGNLGCVLMARMVTSLSNFGLKGLESICGK